ncbi:MAG TPA: hypothetical protein VKX30_06120 [Flavobacteriaceae bacterium]|nr:hypothetical protein [Flavobacteriaceae bacterium]
MEKDERNCLECGMRLLGRLDKRFCNDSCRNTFNNAKNRVKNALIKRTNTQLRKNYQILTKYNTTDKTTVAKQTLSLEGFNFELFTSIYITKANKTYYFVYDQGYLPIHDGKRYLLVKNKSE